MRGALKDMIKGYLKWYFRNVVMQLVLYSLMVASTIIVISCIASICDINKLDKPTYPIGSKIQFFLAEQRNCMYTTDNSYWVKDDLKVYDKSYVFGYLDRVGNYVLIEPKEIIKLRNKERLSYVKKNY